MISSPMNALATSVAALSAEATPAQGALDSAGAGITGGYSGDSLSLKIIIAFLLGLALYNAIELIVLILVTFQRYHGLYFWSLVVATFGIIPYSLGFLIKFFQLLDPSRDVGYVAVFFLSIGWYPMVTGQSVVLWSRLHLLTNSRRVLRWSLYMIIINGVILHSATTVLTFGSNSNSLPSTTLQRFVRGYSIMEKTQMVIFFVQEVVLSAIYIREAIRLLKLSETVRDDTQSLDNSTNHGHLKNAHVRKTMFQLLAINVIIIAMDLALLGVEFANLYLIETTLKGVVYSIKLKLEFAVLGKLVRLVRDRTASDERSNAQQQQHLGLERVATLEKTETNKTNNSITLPRNASYANGVLPDFVDPQQISADVTHAQMIGDTEGSAENRWDTRAQHDDGEKWRRRTTGGNRGSWIDEEMDKHNIV